MTTLTETQTHTAADAVTLADTLNQNYADGATVTVNGVQLWTRHGAVAFSWQNGSVSFGSRAKNGRSVRTHWIKPGQTVTVTTVEREEARCEECGHAGAKAQRHHDGSLHLICERCHQDG